MLLRYLYVYACFGFVTMHTPPPHAMRRAVVHVLPDALDAVSPAALQMRDLEARLLEEREEKAVLAGEPGADQQQP